jgi:hypothetical protein
MGSYVGERLPFETGRYAGHCWWADHKGERGIYTTELQIDACGDGDKVHTTRRIFLKDDGAIDYEKHAQITFKPEADNFISVTFSHEGNEYYGHGYSWRNLCHFDVKLAGGIHLENTFILSKGMIEVIGSSMNNGNLTVWAESLEEVL